MFKDALEFTGKLKSKLLDSEFVTKGIGDTVLLFHHHCTYSVVIFHSVAELKSNALIVGKGTL